MDDVSDKVDEQHQQQQQQQQSPPKQQDFVVVKPKKNDGLISNNDDEIKNQAAAAASSVQKQPQQRRKRRIIRRTNNNNKQDQKKSIDNERIIEQEEIEKVLQQSNLPKAYNFEIYKCLQRIQQLHATTIALQMPEGLLLYATVIGDVLKQLSRSVTDVCVLGDVTYGACCVDDLTASSLQCDLLIHYGHSCLVPIQHTVLPVLYVFVEIQIHIEHFIQSIIVTLNHNNGQQRQPLETADTTITTTSDVTDTISDTLSTTSINEATNNPTVTTTTNHQLSDNTKNTYIYLLGTVQFRHVLIHVQDILQSSPYNYQHVTIPQIKPLSPGEVLGCTSPNLPVITSPNSKSIVIFIADGRFHLESTLISNPHIDIFYRYNPYNKIMTQEEYDYTAMYTLRSNAISVAKQHSCHTFGLILGTLGRQGNPAILQRLRKLLKLHGKKSIVLLLSEITPMKLAILSKSSIQCYVQIACPRLSIDWGHLLSSSSKQQQHPIPVLSPYELFCVFDTTNNDATTIDKSESVSNDNDKQQQHRWLSNNNDSNSTKTNTTPYPMDYYSQTGGPWSNYYQENKNRKM